MRGKKILFFQWISFMNHGMEKALNRLEIAYDTFFYPLENWESDDKFCQMFDEKLKCGCYDKVLSINFTPLISNICEQLGIAYIAWVYDAPVHIRNIQSMKNSCNTIYFFDRGQAEQYVPQGICAKHLPLAVDVDLMKEAIQAGERLKRMEASFVGNLYKTEYAYYTAPCNDYLKGYLEGIICSQMKVYGGYFIPELVTQQLLDKMNQLYLEIGSQFRMGKRELEYMLACEVTGRERHIALALLSSHVNVHVYTKEADPTLTKVQFHGYADYHTVVPKIFEASKINLNVSLKAIQSGIPLRVIEVAGCGGFVLSNYQAELPEYFCIGKECEIYENLEDLLEKTEFYLRHEQLRMQIAQAGFERVKRDFTFEERLKTMLC